VSIGDGPHSTNVTLAQATCRKDGRLLQPSKLLSTLDRWMYIQAHAAAKNPKKSNSNSSSVLSSYSSVACTAANVQIANVTSLANASTVSTSHDVTHPLTFYYILVVDIDPLYPWQLMPRLDFFPVPEAHQKQLVRYQVSI
jgi:hypothetical protein